jgi:hypothetical protein
MKNISSYVHMESGSLHDFILQHIFQRMCFERFGSFMILHAVMNLRPPEPALDIILSHINPVQTLSFYF